MKFENFQLERKIAHILLFIVSVTFTLFLFIQFGTALHEKLLWGAVGISLEIIKLYIFMLSKKNFKERKVFAGGFKMLIYMSIAFVSMVASLGFALTTIQGQSFEAQFSNLNYDSKISELEFIESEIQTKIRQQSELPGDYVTASDRFTQQISELRTQREELLQEISALQEEVANRQTDTNDVFSLIGNTIGFDGQDTLYYLMLIMIIALELCLVLTAGEIEVKLDINASKATRIIEYVESMMDVTGARMKTNDKISTETGIPLNECQMYRDKLQEMKYKGTPLIEARQGGTKANFTKDSILKIVKFYISTDRM